MQPSHLEFYGHHKISPVRQDISDLQRHMQRRHALYFHLGIAPSSISGRTVLEVGPGSGFNSLHTASLNPSRYVLVEGNETGIEHIESLFAGFRDWTENIEIAVSTIENYTSDDQFDFVFCEGLLSGIENPAEILSLLSELTKPGGILTITCVDHLADISEIIRRMFAQMAVDRNDPLDVMVTKILPMIEPHLRTLKGMSRLVDDWIIDNLIHPGSVIPVVNLPQVIDQLASQFEFYSSSPRFISDWRWYKSIVDDGHEFNRTAVQQYWTNVHSLLDHRRQFAPRDADLNIELYEHCTKLRSLCREYERSRSPGAVAQFRTVLAHIIEDVETFSSELAADLNEAHDILADEPHDLNAISACRRFGALFGRGQQYFSFIKLG